VASALLVEHTNILHEYQMNGARDLNLNVHDNMIYCRIMNFKDFFEPAKHFWTITKRRDVSFFMISKFILGSTSGINKFNLQISCTLPWNEMLNFQLLEIFIITLQSRDWNLNGWYFYKIQENSEKLPDKTPICDYIILSFHFGGIFCIKCLRISLKIVFCLFKMIY